MENQHRKITGYRELSQEEIDLMNQIKAVGEAIGTLHASLIDRLQVQYQRACAIGSAEGAIDTACAAIDAAVEAKRNLQTGLMWLTRAVAQPKGF